MRAVLFDLDGVIYESDRPVAGAASAVAWFEREGIPFLFVTNTTSRSREAIVGKLADLGIATTVEHVLTPPVAAATWLSTHIEGPIALFVPEAIRGEFDGLRLLDEDGVEGAAALVIGDLADAWSFERLNRAFQLLMHKPQPALVALGMTRYWQTARGLQLDVAPFVVALEHAAGVEARVMGKPSREFFHTALSLLGVEADETVMIGDDIKGDVEAAQKAGLRAVLVRTGKFRPSDLELGIEPHAVLDSVADLPALFSR